MGKIKRYKNVVEKFLSGEKGQRFFNFAYSIGAAVVIWGALFKILHLPGGNTLLCVGMGTEVLMFILTAFDRPAKEYKWEEVFPVLATNDPEDRPNFSGGGGGGIIIGGNSESSVTPQQARNMVGIPDAINLSDDDSRSLNESIARMAAASEQLSRMAELTDATQQYLARMAAISDQMEQLRATTEALNSVSATLLGSYQAITDNSERITGSATGYADQLESLNRNISGLNAIYEIQLKSISSQLESIDRVNRGLKDIRDMYEKSARESSSYCDETEKLAHNMKQLNGVYERMVKAMTTSIYSPMMHGNAFGNGNNNDDDKNV